MLSKFNRESIQYRFLKYIFIILFAGTCVLSAIIAINEGNMLKHSLMTKGQGIASTIANISQDPLIMKDSIQLDSIVNEAKKDEDIIYIVMQDAKGNPITSQFASINYQSPGGKDILSGLSKDSELPDIIAAIQKKESIAEFSVPITTGADVIGKVTIGMSRHKIRKQILRSILFVIGLNLVAMLVLGSVLFIASRKTILDPIMELGHAVTRLAKGDLSARVRIKTTGEIQMLVSSFNQMSGDLEKTTVSKKTLQTILDSMPYGIIIIDKEKKIQGANRAALALMGYDTEDQIAGMLCQDTLCPAEKDKCPILDLGQELDQSERALITREGKRIPILKSVISIVLDGREVLLEAVMDITGRKLAEEALQKSEEEAKRLAQENAIIAEIGRIIGLTLKIEDIYDRFAEEVRKLIPFDRIVINIINPEEDTATNTYASGIDVQGRRIGDSAPLSGTATEECMRTRSSLLVQPEDIDECIARLPALLPTFQAGIRSIIFIPLISKDQVIGVLSFRASKPNAYTERQLKLAERVGSQIAGAIANAQLFIERKRAEEALQKSEEEAKRLAQENGIIAEIGRIISSTLNIEDVYDRFAEEVGRLVPFDRLSINLINREEQTSMVAYNAGLALAGRNKGEAVPLSGTIAGEVVRIRSSLLIQGEGLKESAGRFPVISALSRAGIQSMMSIPLISKDIVIAVLHLRSLKPDAYTEGQVKLAERVGNQIAGAMANAQLFNERKKAEEALRKSEEEAKQLAQENAIMAGIGRIISSTLNIEEIYERFSEEAGRLIPFDRLVATTNNLNEQTITMTYVTGIEIPGRGQGDIIPLPGTLNEEVIRRKSGILMRMEDEKEFAESSPTLLSPFRAGLRLVLSVPLISEDHVIGALLFWSCKPDAYVEKDIRLAERVGSQIAGAIANAQLFKERKRAEEALQKSEGEAKRLAQENEIIAELGRIISSSLNIDEVYERFTEKVREIVPFDRLTINTFNSKDNTCILQYAAGMYVKGRGIGDVIPLDGSIAGEVIRTRSSLLIQEENRESLLGKFNNQVLSFKAGVRSMMTVPLLSKGEAIGVLHFRSVRPNAYTEEHLRLAEKVGDQISSAIANAQLFIERKQAVEALEKSEKEAKLLAQENAIIANIGRIISSSLDIDKVYERFAEEIRKLMLFDRLAVNIINHDDYTQTTAYVAGIEVEKHHQGDTRPLEGTTSELILHRRSGIIVQAENEREMTELYPGFSNIFRSGVQSKLTVPLISKDQVIGVLHFRSVHANAYTDRDLKLAESIGAHISGAIANAHLYKERKQAEEGLKEYAGKLQMSNTELQDFAYVASHDLQEPLRKITYFGDRLKIKLGDSLDEQNHDYLDRMLNATIRMQTLINGLLMYSRVSTKAQPFESVSLSLVVREVVNDLEVRIDQAHGTVETGDLPTVQADPLQMRQLFQNLIGNALKFHKKEEAPAVSISSRSLEGRHGSDRSGQSNGDWEITVRDNGIGFDEKYTDRIFTVFQRLHGRSEYEGSGIGLAICRKIVERHGGSITAKSSPGAGSAFIFTLPASNNTKGEERV